MSELLHYRDAISKWNGQLHFTYEEFPLAILCQIRDELQQLNRTLGCRNVAKGFRALTVIAKHNDAAFKRRVANAVRKRKVARENRGRDHG